MLEAREVVEHEIWWKINGGTSNVWYENWTKRGALHHIVSIGQTMVDDYKHREIQKLTVPGTC
uniref:Uncharacterized protein n=1 Tax=Solanum tuberosum TaxID=4113 RepID=M1BG97_SOLTU